MNEPLIAPDSPFDPADLRFDFEVQKVCQALLEMDSDGSRTAKVIRLTIDMIYDGRHTGRYRWDELYKTEKTHAGTLLEINLQREFDFSDGNDMDFKIAGVDVDCKYSQRSGGWMIPPEARGHLCLLVWFSDLESRWELGVVRIDPRILSGGENRDLKKTIRSEARSAIQWVHRDAPLAENVLLKLPPEDIAAIFEGPRAKKSGRFRINQLFRRAQRRLISRNVVETVGMQKDSLKRVRSNGGARSDLQGEGIVIFGDDLNHQAWAASLGLPVPGKGEFISARLVPYDGRDDSHRIKLDGGEWVLANDDDPVWAAPRLPEKKQGPNGR
jgi:hypothetical protein